MTRRKKPNEDRELRACRTCDTKFYARRAWQVFCSPKCRNEYHTGHQDKCFYCGALSSGKDFEIPRYAKADEKETYTKLQFVPVCSNCQNVLRGEVDKNFNDRALRLIDKHMHKHDLRFGMSPPKWTIEELDELGPNLITTINAGVRNRIKAEARLIHMLAVYYWWNGLKGYTRELVGDGTVTKRFLEELYKTDKCYYCGFPTSSDRRTMDHKLPVIRGGLHSASNLVMACKSCNSAKRDKTDLEFKELIKEAIAEKRSNA
jgi:5-methylcytosine-specific restriction endonuclease McrA